ncbi:MAG TPA: SDR family NAD(P)-dependent oxidoreductase [Candidatus Binatia bacterium]|jgi:NAD(P)-dependent dehydrogenase (short-subunit alcohol dehydrogenase family)|nr:SDR family NAD(P)-dependent oxidoreductase [Candidatus Binatia bacterium]
MSKSIVVTGGAGGIGSDICRALGADGLKIVVADYAGEAAEKVAAEIRDNKGDAVAVKVDVGDPESVAEMMQQAIGKYGQIDYMFCGAGVMDRIPVVDMPEQVWDRLMRINLKGVFLCAQAAAKHMIPRKEGRILSIASGRGVAGAPNSAHYAASKAGVIAFTKSLAAELAPHNITVNCVCPGATDTPMSRIGYTPEQFKKREDIPPLMDGLTQKFEIVGLVRYLLSEATKYVTGQTFFLRTPK